MKVLYHALLICLGIFLVPVAFFIFLYCSFFHYVDQLTASNE